MTHLWLGDGEKACHRGSIPGPLELLDGGCECLLAIYVVDNGFWRRGFNCRVKPWAAAAAAPSAVQRRRQ